MNKCILISLAILLVAGVFPASAEPDYPNIYKFYMELGKFAIQQGDYQEAYANFQHALAVAPREREPVFFINLIKRMQDQRIEPEPDTQITAPSGKSRAQIIEESLDAFEPLPTKHKIPMPAPVTRFSDRITAECQSIEEKKPPSVKTGPVRRQTFEPEETLMSPGKETVFLDEALWNTQPGTLIRIEMRSSVQLEGRNIERYLIITPGVFEVERIDGHRLKIIGKKRGSSFLHVWDEKGRWTFNIEVIIPMPSASLRLREAFDELQADPFKVTYAADWGSYYRGPTFADAERESLKFLQRVMMEGETPYGDLDSHVVFNKFQESTEVTGYGIGLTDGKIGDFKDFSIRGFDLRKTFSPLSMPGQYVRGVLFEAMAFDQNLAYSYIHGRDRQIYSYLSADVLDSKESFIEGARATLFPKEENQYSLNYARGYGDAREAFLKDQVMSFEAQRRIKDVLLSGEVGYDEEATAVTSQMLYNKEDHRVTVSFRDIDEDYTTIASYPSRRGEVGGSILWNWKLGDVDIDTYLDLYRERLQPNPDATGTMNVDFNSRVDVPLSASDQVSASVYYNDTSGELSPRNSVRVNTRYTKRFPFFSGRDFTAFIGATQQRSRFARATSSDSDRYSLMTGISVPLGARLNYYANYEFSWLYDHEIGDLTGPNVLNTGLNYSRQLVDGWSMYTGFNYRDEENTGGTNSFLAGEDSITGSIGTSFRPSEDFELFIDGRARNIWGQEEDRASFNEYDVNVGVRTSWETPFRWNPKGTVKGIVYKDLNGNQRQDEEETGIPDVRVQVGEKAAITNALGIYRATVRGKAAEVTLDMSTIPDGFVFSTPVMETVTIIPHKTHRVDFGLTTQSGIYGIVFYDQNGDGKPDDGDEFISKARVVLDGEKTAFSDFEGAYFFENVLPGEHEIAIEMNSLPITYLPKVKLKNTIITSEGSTYVFHIPLDKTKKE